MPMPMTMAMIHRCNGRPIQRPHCGPIPWAHGGRTVSRRLFDALEAGCVPVLVRSWFTMDLVGSVEGFRR